MGAPPVQYVRTSDGYSIAYTVSGRGFPFMFLPSFMNHVQDVWTEGLSVANLLRDATERHQVVNYDSRGMGLSTRGLAEDFSLESYFDDLDAVLQRLSLNQMVMLGFASFGFLAVSYALRHPERVAALILVGPPYRWLPAIWEQLPREDWEGFLADHVARSYDPETARRIFEMFKHWVTQEDYLTSLRAWETARSEMSLSGLQTPTLVLWSRGLRVDDRSVADFTRLLPKGQFAILDSGLPYGAPGEAIEIIEPFLRSAGVRPVLEDEPSFAEPDTTLVAALSTREAEVLRLLAAGRSNQQIADDLVISLNTVRRHVSNIFDKTGAANRAQAAIYARDHGLA